MQGHNDRSVQTFFVTIEYCHNTQNDDMRISRSNMQKLFNLQNSDICYYVKDLGVVLFSSLITCSSLEAI